MEMTEADAEKIWRGGSEAFQIVRQMYADMVRKLDGFEQDASLLLDACEKVPLAWIPVRERLPPLMTEVLGWHPADRVRAWFRHSGTVNGGPCEGTYWEQWSPQDRECDDCEVDEPTHWMPLPEPPEVK